MEVIAYRAESGKMRDVVDVALVVLLKLDINAFVDLKEKYLPHGLKQAIRMQDHPFWQNEGLEMWEEIKALVNARLDLGYWFGQSMESPAVVGIFRTESE